MLRLTLSKRQRYSILCLGAHSDDIEIGCGGSVLRLLRDHDNVSVHWVVFGAQQRRADEASASAQCFLERADQQVIVTKGFRDGFFPYTAVEIKEYFEELKATVSPDIVFTHYRNDRHQDHRLISDLTWNTFRNHLILEYEIPKYDGDLGNPNLYIGLDEDDSRRKVELLLHHFQTQSNKHWFTEDTFFSLLRLRGIETDSDVRYAEAFYARKLSL